MAELDAMAPKRTKLFVSGTDGYHTYRIPAVIVTRKGTVLAFCEGRKGGRSDAGNIDMMLKRSTDGGATWSKQQVVWDDGGNTCGNPCPVVDEETGAVWLTMTWNRGDDRERQIIDGSSKDTRRVFVACSEDDGLTWSKPREITKGAKRPEWTWYATGPCTGIQLERGEHKGRLVIPCDHIEAGTKKYYSHVIFSDDHGATWELGGSTPTDEVNECQVVELADGRLMLNMRNYYRVKKNRAVSVSSDGGMTWSALWRDASLAEPRCQASIFRYSLASDGGKDRLLFSNPAHPDSRVNMTVKMSYDEGKTWAVAKTLHGGPAAYSCLAVLDGGEIACLYEAGDKGAYETIVFERFSLEWLTDGKDK
jgi:sialidase-1